MSSAAIACWAFMILVFGIGIGFMLGVNAGGKEAAFALFLAHRREMLKMKWDREREEADEAIKLMKRPEDP